MGFKFYKLLQYVLYIRQYYSTIAKILALNNANKAFLLLLDGKISQHMQYRSAGANALIVWYLIVYYNSTLMGLDLFY